MKPKVPLGPFEAACYLAIALLGAIIIYHNIQIQNTWLPSVPIINGPTRPVAPEMDFFDRKDGFRCYFFVGNESQYRCYERTK